MRRCWPLRKLPSAKSSACRSSLLRTLQTPSYPTARFILKRIAKENVKKFGRLIGKTSHSDPINVFIEILDKVRAYLYCCEVPVFHLRPLFPPRTQVQVYENVIPVVVDAFKYLSPLAYDVLAFCVIEVRET